MIKYPFLGLEIIILIPKNFLHIYYTINKKDNINFKKHIVLICNSNMKAEILNFKKVKDPRGNLSVVQEYKDVPFKIERVYWIYDIPSDEFRAGHAYRQQQECIIALSGSFSIEINDGNKSIKYHLHSPSSGLLIPSKHWRQLSDFSTNCVCLVLSSKIYNADDYIRDIEEFISLTKTIR